MGTKWKNTKFPGVRYREHPTRRYGVNPDRYFTIRAQVNGGRREEGLGWASRGWTAERANAELATLKEAHRLGKGPHTLKEKREREQAKREAEQARREAEKREGFTFGELAEQYLKWAKANKKSWSDDEQRYERHLKPVLGEIPLKDVSPLLLEKLKRQLQAKKRKSQAGGKEKPQEKNLSPATVKHCLVLVRQMFNKATAWGLFDGSNPVKKVKLPGSLNNRRVRFLTHEEAHRLLEALKTRSPQVRDQALLSLHCGLRFGEIASLTWGDLDFRHDIIQIRSPKSGEDRQAFMTVDVKEMLRSRMPEDAKTSALVFPARKRKNQRDVAEGGEKKQRAVSKVYDRTVEELGLNQNAEDSRDRVCFHTLRHTFASWLAIQGTPLFTIKELMGHKTLAMTERYAHLIPDHKREAVNGLAMRFNESMANDREKGADKVASLRATDGQ